MTGTENDMRAGRGVVLGAVIAVFALSACGDRADPKLRVMRAAGTGPDEFAILPPKPLTLPTDFTALPEPTLGEGNLTDPTPLDDAVVALGGRPGAGGGDAALSSAATRYGVSGTIRTDLAADDRETRRANRPRLFERLFGTDVYNRAYEKQSVDQYPELERWRDSGRRTPSAPPDPATTPSTR